MKHRYRINEVTPPRIRPDRFGVLVHARSGALLGWLPKDHSQEPRHAISGAAIFATREAATAYMQRFERLYRGRGASLSVWRLDNQSTKAGSR